MAQMTRQEAARELLRRKRCQDSFHSFCLNVEVPLNPNPPLRPDEDLLGPAHTLMPIHLAKICEVLERTATRPMGRCMIFAPPGSAKSAYTSVSLPAWFMGKFPGSHVILASYASDLAEKQSRRCQSIVEQAVYREIFGDVRLTKDAAGEWDMSNKSSMLAAGIRGGITGARADLVVIDDPVKNQEEADSEPIQARNTEEYNGSILTRLRPNAKIAFIMTRWNENDLAGKILPDDYKGQSGMVKCKDGLYWEVLNIPAKAEHLDDPLGRPLGEYMWPEFFGPAHWAMFEQAQGQTAARVWASLFQQRPTTAGAGTFTREMFQLYDADDLPLVLTHVGAGDYAVTEGRNDFTELGVWGMDSASHLWALDWWFKQCDTGESIDVMMRMIEQWKTRIWFNEGGVIDKAMRPAFNRRAREMMAPGEHRCNDALCHLRHDVYTDLRSLPSIKDKLAKAMNFQARASIGTIHLPRHAPWTERIILQLLSLPSGRYDDAADVCGLIGRGIDQIHPARKPVEVKKVEIKPFTAAWFEHQDPEPPKVRWR